MKDTIFTPQGLVLQVRTLGFAMVLNISAGLYRLFLLFLVSRFKRQRRICYSSQYPASRGPFDSRKIEGISARRVSAQMCQEYCRLLSRKRISTVPEHHLRSINRAYLPVHESFFEMKISILGRISLIVIQSILSTLIQTIAVEDFKQCRIVV